jgi:Leucine-rich repeat (LRR) protein
VPVRCARSVANGESTELDLSNSTSGIQRLPEAALGSGKVESLCLANSVGDITTESFHQKLTMLGQRDLRRIDLEGNRLQDVHESVLSMPKLETLILRDNALRTLTPEIARLNMLTEVWRTRARERVATSMPNAHHARRALTRGCALR